MKKILLAIDGMSCSACSNGLEKYLKKQEGILEASVNLVMANARIEYDEELLTFEQIEKFVEEAGFQSLGRFEEKDLAKKQKEEKLKLAIFSILAVILMYISMGHMIGLPEVPFLAMQNNPIGYAGSMLILTCIFFGYGFDILKAGVRNIWFKSPNMDTLVTIGVFSSFGYSLFSIFQIISGNVDVIHQLYFESSAIVLYLVKLGRYIDKRSKDKTKSAIQELVQITPNHAVIRGADGKEKTVTIDEIQKGDIVLCKPGEKIAVDGKIVQGKAHLDEAFLTGESKPSVKKVGDTVIAGSINYDGYLEYTAEKIGKDSTISEIVRLVLDATSTKAPIAKVADKVSSYFVPAVILIAVATGLFDFIVLKDVQIAIQNFVTVLVVACPCSLGLATPLAIVVSEGICAQKGILVKKSEILEKAEKITTVVFDKTGTLTFGTLKIASILCEKSEENDIMKIAGSLEAKSSHPIGKAFINYLAEKKIEKQEVREIEEISGMGICGKVFEKQVILGNDKILEKYQIPNDRKKEAENLAKEGNSIVYVVIDGKVKAVIGVNDLLRENAKEVIAKFHKQNIETIMLTGDHQETAEKIAKQIGITTVIAEVLPSQKVEKVKSLKKEGKIVCMCGDGINDSPALAASDIGVSIHGASDIAMDSADVILTQSDLSKMFDLIQISRKTIRNIKQNLFWAFFYNTLMIPVAMGIFRPFGVTINPMLASLAMMMSSFTVILNALRLKRIKK